MSPLDVPTEAQARVLIALHEGRPLQRVHDRTLAACEARGWVQPVSPGSPGQPAWRQGSWGLRGFVWLTPAGDAALFRRLCTLVAAAIRKEATDE